MKKTAEKQKEIKYPHLVNDGGSLTQTEKQILGNFIILSGAKTMLELGMFKAVTTKYICNFMIENNIDGKLYGFDIPEVIENLSKDPELRKFIDKDILELVPGWLPFSLKKWLSEHDEPIDFVLDDALHDYPSVYGELKLIWPRLAKHGFILCHDYVDHFEGVTYAVDKFARKHNVQVLPLLSSDYARNNGYASVLVGLRKKEHRRGLFTIFKQEFYPYKSKLAKLTLWKSYIKPLVRR